MKKKIKKIFSINAELGYRNYTVKDLQDIKGKIKLSQILVSTQNEARAAEEAGVELRDYLLETEIPFVSEVPSILGLDDILPKTLGDLINLDIKDKQIDFPRWDEQKLFERFKTFIKDLPQVLIEACLAKLTELISYFIPPEIPIPFTLCTFLSVIGFPKEISVNNLVLEGT